MNGYQHQLSSLQPRLHCSPRQSQILSLMADGLTDKEIARCLGLSPHTVRTYFERFLLEHGIRNRTAAVAVWVRFEDNVRAQHPPAPRLELSSVPSSPGREAGD